MQLLIFIATTVAGLVGGLVILSRSLNASARAIASALLGLALWQVGALAFITGQVPLAFHLCLLVELVVVGLLLAVLCTIEGSLAKRVLLVWWTKFITAAICVLYAVSLILFPGRHVRQGPVGFEVGILGIVQSLLVLVGVVACLWIMENVLRSAGEDQRRALAFPSLGVASICTAFLIGAMYRIGMHAVSEGILVLTSLMMLLGIALVTVFSLHLRPFAMNVTVPRYVIYRSITFIGVGLYLCISALIIFGIQDLGLDPALVMAGFLVFCTILVVLLLVLSPELRARMKFFISTHFFINKYDYRREWSEMSRYLSVAATENQILHVTAQVILESMYIRELSIWLRGDDGFTCALAFPRAPIVATVAHDDPFLDYLSVRPFLRSRPVAVRDRLWERVVTADATFVEANHIEMAVPMTSENAVVGFIAVGRENPGSTYGTDDIDLLTNIAAQCGAALMQARFAQQLAENKEVDTYNYLSASLLHDLKNAAGHLSLILQNAPRHIDQKDFQEDMLATVAQSLARIDKVINKLGRLPDKVTVSRQNLTVEPFVQALLRRLKPRLADIRLIVRMEPGLTVNMDPDMLERMLENLIVNASEAVAPQGEITITASRSGGGTAITVADDGPGLTEEFVKDKLFKPFQTTKPAGTGIGLWHVKNMAQQVGARIVLDNRRTRGAAFTIVFPDEGAKGGEGQNHGM